ncbi:MAG: hypothetical protein ABR564_00040 [Candidatus Dormibacteria bacterium]
MPTGARMRGANECATADLDNAFASAAARRPDLVSRMDRCIGGRSVAATVVGADLAGHLRRALPSAPVGAPALRISVWDVSETDVPPPLLSGWETDGIRPGSDGDVFSHSRDRRHIRHEGPNFLLWLDRRERHIIGWVRSTALLRPWLLNRPFQLLLAPWLSDIGVRLLHAAMVAPGERAVLLPGPSGAGKSTTAVVCLRAGHHYLGDEAAAVEAGAGAVTGHCVNTPAKLNDGDGVGAGETFLYPGDTSPEQVRLSAPIAAIAFPRVAGTAASRFTRMPARRALPALMACLISAEAGRVGSDFEFLSGLVERLPCFELELGRDAAGTAAAVAELSRQARP